MKKIKSSWFRFWAAVLAILGVVHSKDANARTFYYKTLQCGGPVKSGDLNNTVLYEENCRTESYTSEEIVKQDITTSGAVDCYCDDKTLLKYSVSCIVTSYLDPDSETTHYSYDLKKGDCDKAVCDPGDTQDCTTTDGSGTQTCNAYGQWGSCDVTTCANGYLMIDGTCHETCTIDGGTGYKKTLYEDVSDSSSTEA
ncbi:MAG: hypothetical protein Q4E56_03935 [Pseudomonadota bacterium]|nr:hypothetical protein [Pseudomonadota bacterium]